MFRIFDPIAREIEKLVSEQVSSVRMERLQLKSKTKSAVKVRLSCKLSTSGRLSTPVTTLLDEAYKHFFGS